MNRWKLCSAVVALALMAATMFVPASNAQTPRIPIVAVGSSGFFGASGLAAIKGDPIHGGGPLCGTRFWTGTLTGIDSRTSITPSIPPENASAWVAWDNDTAPTVICTYLATDSVIGQRLFFGVTGTAPNQVNGSLSIPTSACTAAAGNKISFIWDTARTGLPVAIWNALQGGNATLANCSDNTNTLTPVHFNVAFTDVRSEDAQFLANNRIVCADANTSAQFPPDDKSCLGFGGTGAAGNPGVSVLSSYSTAKANVVNYAFTGTDPISGTAVPAAQQIPLGAQAALVFVNINDNVAGSGGFGDLFANGFGAGTPKFNTVTSHSLSQLYSGQAFLTRDVYGLAGANLGAINVVAVHALLREPPSGTYTTFEWQVIRQRDGNTTFSQETSIAGPSQSGIYTSGCFAPSGVSFPPLASPCSNPLNTTLGSSTALRSRVIGTGQMISTGNSTSFPDTLGYAFWSLGNFGNKNNVRYLKLDGVDALFPDGSYTGVFPGGVAGQGTSATLPAPAAGQCGGYFNGDGGVTITNFSCGSAGLLPTFDGILNGSYRFWNIIDADYYGAVQTPAFGTSLNIAGFILSAQNQTNPPAPVLTDFVPSTYCGEATCNSANYKHPLNFFRSHYAINPGWGIGNACNGVNSTGCNGVTPGVENGGDVAGAITSIALEDDFGNILSNSLTSWIQ